MIYLLKGDCAYGQLEQKFATIQLKMVHQKMKRDKYRNTAKNLKISLAEYLWKDLDVEQDFIDFGNQILNMGYDEEPDYDHL